MCTKPQAEWVSGSATLSEHDGCMCELQETEQADDHVSGQWPQVWTTGMGKQLGDRVCKPQSELATMDMSCRMPQFLFSTHHLLVFFREPASWHNALESHKKWYGADIPRGQTAPLLSYRDFSLLWFILMGYPFPNMHGLWLSPYLAKGWMTVLWERVFGPS